MTILWTVQAREDLKEIFTFISRDSKKYAHLQISRIRSKTKILKSNSFLGRVVPEFQNDNVRELVQGNYRIIYHVAENDVVEIMLVHHGARDLTKRITDTP